MPMAGQPSMNVIDLTDGHPERHSSMTEQGDLPRVNFPQPKYSVSHYAGSYTPVLEKKYFAWVGECTMGLLFVSYFISL